MIQRPVRIRQGFTLVEFLLVLTIIGVILSLLMPALARVRESSRRAHCMNGLRQLSTAVQNYAEQYGVFPPGAINPDGPILNEPLGYHHSWLVQLLAHMEQGAIQNAIDTGTSVYSASNQTVRESQLSVLLCPADRAPTKDFSGVGQTNYAACHHDVEAPIDVDNHGVFFLNSALRYESLADGSSTTFFFGEKLRTDRDLGWISGTRATLRNTGTALNAPDPFDAIPSANPRPTGPSAAPSQAELEHVGGFSSRHPGGALFAFGDGSVRFVRQTIHQRVYQCLGNRDDGEMIDARDY